MCSGGPQSAIQGFPPNTKYTVVTHAVARPKYQEEFLVMIDQEKRAFECVLPASKKQPPTEDAELETPTTNAAGSDEPAPSLDAFLHHLSGRCFLRNEGYWSFEICHRKKIRQFHDSSSDRRNPQGPVSVEYSLGDFFKVWPCSCVREEFVCNMLLRLNFKEFAEPAALRHDDNSLP